MNKPFFSIIVVSLNAKDYIKDTINSVLNQSFDDYEIVVKDGLSTDGTVDNIPPSDKIRIFEEKDKSIYDAMNQAICHSTGKYLCFLNCGDYFENSDVLKNIYDTAKNYEDAVIYGNYSRKGVVFKQPSNITPFYLYRTPLCHQTMFFAKTLFDEKLYDTSLKILADYEHTLSDFKAGRKFVYVPVTACDYMGGGVSESENGRRIKKQEYNAIKKLYFSKSEIKKYDFRLKLSMKKLRQKMISDSVPKWVRKLYRFMVNKVNK